MCMGGGGGGMKDFIAKETKVQKVTFDATKLHILSSQATVTWVERESSHTKFESTLPRILSTTKLDPLHVGGWFISEHLGAYQSGIFETNRGVQSPK